MAQVTIRSTSGTSTLVVLVVIIVKVVVLGYVQEPVVEVQLLHTAKNSKVAMGSNYVDKLQASSDSSSLHQVLGASLSVASRLVVQTVPYGEGCVCPRSVSNLHTHCPKIWG
eukprot:1812889-Amphidinium_carterae.2